MWWETFTGLVPSISAISVTLRGPPRRKQAMRSRSGAASACNFSAQLRGRIFSVIGPYSVSGRAGPGSRLQERELARRRAQSQPFGLAPVYRNLLATAVDRAVLVGHLFERPLVDDGDRRPRPPG